MKCGTSAMQDRGTIKLTSRQLSTLVEVPASICCCCCCLMRLAAEMVFDVVVVFAIGGDAEARRCAAPTPWHTGCTTGTVQRRRNVLVRLCPRNSP